MNVICLFLFRLLLYFWFVIIYILLCFFHGCLFIMNYFHIFQPLLLIVYDSLFFFFDFDLLLLFSFIYFQLLL